MNKRYTNRTKRHKYRAQHGATITIIIRQSSSSLLYIALLHINKREWSSSFSLDINCPPHCATITANFVEISNALEPTWNKIENIQKSALGIIVPSMPHSQALHLTGLPSLQERRESACIRFISKISPGNPLYALILSRSQPRESPYNLRRNTNIVTKQTNTDRFAQFVTCKYATYLDS